MGSENNATSTRFRFINPTILQGKEDVYNTAPLYGIVPWMERIMRLCDEYPRAYHIFKFLVAGTAAAGTNLGLLFVLTEYAHIWYLTSAVISFIVAFFVSFSLQKFWTFADRTTDTIGTQAFTYVLIQGWDLAFNAGALYLMVDGLHIWYMGSQFFISVVIAVQNYFLYKLFIFGKV